MPRHDLTPPRHISTLGLCLLAAVLASAHGTALAAEQTVSQKGKAFSVKKLKVKVGDSVKFLNEDPFSHNVFSLSDAKNFDLGSYPQGGAKSVTFDKAGTIEVECAIHPDMAMVIEVEK
ncbi:cupredoxin domain-containing protein [Sphaerotilus sp.]|uniref:cupredoxin domain-containing protein n=1 Tax=Sphaerotilus sp. TaxID=2093942 RepID=UPI002ACDE1D0|nr:plastocyanin/azurin family copper-binding protein [Sphaerotilus sp.]MDZ7858698.1 plastocyanin/azurin family copper-binding protein [Sphaerotilus sp.]